MSESSITAANVIASPVEAARFDVFLSHNSKEKPTVERIAERLKRAGLEPWLDKWHLTPGGDWQEELATGLRASFACAVFVGPHGIGSWEDLEFRLATDRMAKDRAFRLFLVLLPGLPEPFDASALPPFLSLRTWVDLRPGLDDKRAFQSLVNAIKGLPLGPERAIEPNDDVCPYRGLRSFDEEHAEYFFGRDGDIQRLVEKLKTTRFLAVLGASGSGKSSVVRAGLIPALRKGQLPSSDQWPIQVFTPTAHPLTQLTANLLRLYPQGAMSQTLDQMLADQRTLHLALALAMADRPAGERAVLVVDQFEEIFTLCRDERERAQFLANLLYAAFVPDGRCVVLLTMRADFYQKCAAYPELSARLAEQQFLVSPMSPDGLRQAIEEPAWRVGLEFESGLVTTILNDIENQPGALPLLEHALLELWERRRGGMLTLEAYRESGGIEGAIAKRADAIFQSFSKEQQEIVRRVMLRLTQPGEGTEDTRRRASLGELVTRAGDNEAIEVVLQSLTEARLLTTSGDEQSGDKVVDVSHEALIRGWPQLRKWIDDDRAGLRMLRRLTDAAQEWQRANRDSDLLFRGARLALAVEWRAQNDSALNELEREFLGASVALRDRKLRAERRRTRLTIGGLAAVLAVISIFAGVSYRESRIAEARAIGASSLLVLPIDRELSLLLAIEAAEATPVRPMPRIEDALRLSLVAGLPVDQAGRRVVAASNTAFGPRDGASVTPTRNGAKRAVISDDGNAVRIWDENSRSFVMELRGHSGAINDAEFSPDGRFIITASNDGTARLWEAGSGRTHAQLLGHTGPVTEAAFSPDSRFVVTVGRTDAARVWKTGSGRELFILEGTDNGASKAGFFPDGRRLAVTGTDGVVKYYECDLCGSLDELLPLARRAVTRQLTPEERQEYLLRTGRSWFF